MFLSGPTHFFINQIFAISYSGVYWLEGIRFGDYQVHHVLLSLVFLSARDCVLNVKKILCILNRSSIIKPFNKYLFKIIFNKRERKLLVNLA